MFKRMSMIESRMNSHVNRQLKHMEHIINLDINFKFTSFAIFAGLGYFKLHMDLKQIKADLKKTENLVDNLRYNK